jgi:two-component system OmpR family response regulator
MSKVLYVEDDADLSAKVRNWLTRDRHNVEVVGNGNEALGLVRVYKYDLIILDLNLPELSGLDICREFRRLGGTTPIMMLTGKGEVKDKTTSLDAGADDYLTKPFHFEELSSRVKALLRRPTNIVAEVISVGGLTLETGSSRVTNGGTTIQLLPKEFALLQFLMRHPNQVFSAEALLDRIWASDSDSSANTVRTYMYTLRKKICPRGSAQMIQTVHGVGYRLDVPQAGANKLDEVKETATQC